MTSGLPVTLVVGGIESLSQSVQGTAATSGLPVTLVVGGIERADISEHDGFARHCHEVGDPTVTVADGIPPSGSRTSSHHYFFSEEVCCSHDSRYTCGGTATSETTVLGRDPGYARVASEETQCRIATSPLVGHPGFG